MYAMYILAGKQGPTSTATVNKVTNFINSACIH